VGAVDADVATAMAGGARERLAATYGLATTGVAGPDPQDGIAPGTVFVALVGPHGARGAALRLSGDRASVREAAVRAALELLETAADLVDRGEHPG
jgi:nicotinamide-nucleotide amidase